MNVKALMARFDLVSEQPANIPILRKLVISLALSGNLSNGCDRTAQALNGLEVIAAERKRLIATGRLRKQKLLPPIADEELPGDPGGCIFERLGNLAILEKGLTGIQNAVPGEFPLVVTSETRSSCDHFDFDGKAAVIPMISSAGHGKASLKKVHYQEGKFALGNILCAAFPIREEVISARFLYEYLNAFRDELLVSRMSGTANVSLTIGKIGEVPVPIVAPEVQRRVDALMVMFDRFEYAIAARERQRDRLAAASLRHLNQPAVDTPTLCENVRLFLRQFPHITTRPEHIQSFRQCVVNLAVRGQLVKQDPNDESISSLLKLVQECKHRWYDNGNKETSR